MDKNKFWRILKRNRSSNNQKTSAIKNKAGVVVHDVRDILEVWRDYFSRLCTPKADPSYDHNHYVNVTEQVHSWLEADVHDTFLEDPISFEEVKSAINKLNSGKAPGADNITSEHVKYGGDAVIEILCWIFNQIVALEYIPGIFRTGIQIPLHKGKNTSILDTDNYRGITLLVTYNKLFEIVIWGRVSTWWMSKNVISPLQGAGREGLSCVHSALLLQETISTNLETNSKVFVTYLDVSKAFDSVWIDGLFYQLHSLGIVGRLWRLLYKTYVNFKCQVRIGDQLSQWYSMQCGIHQGGYLSLVKYISFINSLISELEMSRCCCYINNIPSTPVGYADDLATASISKYKVDRVLRIAHSHSTKWRYKFNAKKSAILVYGESKTEAARNSPHRMYILGSERVCERDNYDHVGIKSCTRGDFSPRTLEKIHKGRKSFNASTGIGIKRRGVDMNTCNLLFWSLIVPITTFGAELWILNEHDVRNLENFQKYVGRRCQRFHQRTPSVTSFRGLGWLRLETFIYAKKMLFIRTILTMPNDMIHKVVFLKRLHDFDNNIDKACENKYFSPTFDLLRVSMIFRMYDMVLRMANGTHVYSKLAWKKIVWTNAWKIDDEEWNYTSALFNDTHYLYNTTPGIKYPVVWWDIANLRSDLIPMCETMSKLVCRASELKSDDFNTKNQTHSVRACSLCDNFYEENVEHLILQCAFNHDIRSLMMEDVSRLCTMTGQNITEGDHNILYILLGKSINGCVWEEMVPIWITAGLAISEMYRRILLERAGVG